MSWQPCLPVETTEAVLAWQAWRKARKLQQQRDRRAELRRIDYYPSEAAAACIDSLTHRSAGGDYASVIDRMILAGADKLPE